MFDSFDQVAVAVPLYYGERMARDFQVEFLTLLPLFDGALVVTAETVTDGTRAVIARVVATTSTGEWQARWIGQAEHFETVRHLCEDWQADHMDAYHDLATADR